MEYIHKVQYYETDKMAIVHHSNYIRWFEEARIDFLAKELIPFDEMEKMGIMSPVVEVSCKYVSPARFGDSVKIQITVSEMGNVKFSFKYLITDLKTGQTRAQGCSEHCFTDASGKVVSLKRENPALFEKMKILAEKSR